MKRYEDYMYCSPMTDGEEMRAFFDDEPEKITAEKAREFWRELRVSFGYDPDGNDTHGVVTAKHVAEKLGITE